MTAAGGKRGLPGFYARPLKRLKEIETLTRWRQRIDGYTAPHAALAVAGHALAALERMRRRHLPRHPGFDFGTADEFLNRAGIDLTARDIVDIVEAVVRSRCCEKPFVMSAVEAGKLLDLTRDERTNLGITTIEAIDEAPADRAARTAEWKRTNDRLRRRRETDERRAKAGLPPLNRDKPKAPPTRPWEAAGMTKATFYRRKAKGLLMSETAVSRTYTEPSDETAVSRSYTAPNETDVSRSLRSNEEVVRHAGLIQAQLVAQEDPAGQGAAKVDGQPTLIKGGAHSPRPSVGEAPREGAAAERLTSLAEISWAETSILLLLGRGDADEGRRVASMIDPASIRRWIAAVRNGTLSGDERVDLEFVRIRIMQTLRQAS